MSSEALAWAFKADVRPSSVKFTLVALCECANYHTGKIFPSIEHLCQITGQDRKTVISNISKLVDQGLICETGEKVGRTGQIKVYTANIGTVPKTEQYQKRNSTESPSKESQKRDTEPSREPSRDICMKVERPESVSEEVWNDFLAMRKAKKNPLTQTALKMLAKQADLAGWSLEDAIAEAISRGWLSFKAEWVKERNNGKANWGGSPDRRSSLARAIDEGLDFLG
jgi:DNA-binding transcriptional MocR family regulator